MGVLDEYDEAATLKALGEEKFEQGVEQEREKKLLCIKNLIERYNLNLDQVCKENNLTEDEISKLKEMLSK